MESGGAWPATVFCETTQPVGPDQPGLRGRKFQTSFMLEFPAAAEDLGKHLTNMGGDSTCYHF